ncbi:MAG: hypothetical protein CL681_24655 [Blastopirellula sp.]|nr:hypothetical protein [Blastopirellula sp.]
MIRLAYRSHLKMLLRLLVTHFLRQMAQEKVMDAVTQAAREHSGQVEGQDLQPEELPMCDIGIVFATGVESGGVVDQLEAARHTSSPSLTEYSGVFHGTPVVVWETGMGREAAARATEELIRTHSPKWVVSTGFAAALSPELARGHVLMPNRIVDLQGSQLDVGFTVADEVAEASPWLHIGDLLTVDEVMRQPARRRLLHQETNALACDMETLGVAEACRAHKQRFMAVRVVSDAVDDTLPPAIENLMEQKSWAGKLGAASGALLKSPATIKQWWELKEQATKLSDRLARFLSGVVTQLPAE